MGTESDKFISGSATVTLTKDLNIIIKPEAAGVGTRLCYIEISPMVPGDSAGTLRFTYETDSEDAAIGYLTEDYRSNYDWQDQYGLDRIDAVTDKNYDETPAAPHPNPQKVNYIYDSLGRRVVHEYLWYNATQDPDALDPDSPWHNKQMVYDGVKLIEERYFDDNRRVGLSSLKGKLIRRYYYEEGINKLAMVEEYFGATTPANVYIPLTDERGTLMGVIDGKSGNATYGQIIEKLYYNSTGLCKSYTANGTTENLRPDGTGYNLARSQKIPFGWCGMARDAFTGHYHTHFRDYDPIHARWLSEDPAGYKDGLNLYAAYMGVNGVDLLGLDKIQGTVAHDGWVHIYHIDETNPAVSWLYPDSWLRCDQTKKWLGKVDPKTGWVWMGLDKKSGVGLFSTIDAIRNESDGYTNWNDFKKSHCFGYTEPLTRKLMRKDSIRGGAIAKWQAADALGMGDLYGGPDHILTGMDMAKGYAVDLLMFYAGAGFDAAPLVKTLAKCDDVKGIGLLDDFSNIKSVDLSVEAGYKGGNAYGLDRLRKLKVMLEKVDPRVQVSYGKYVDGSLDAIGARAAFREIPSKPGHMQFWLRTNSTSGDVIHELIHYKYWKQMGPEYSNLDHLAREQLVFDKMCNYDRINNCVKPGGILNKLPAPERKLEIYNINRLGGSTRGLTH